VTRRAHLEALAAIVVLIVIAIGVGAYILGRQGATLPGWFPLFGTHYYTLRAELGSAQGITPGQGEAVTVAGVRVGEITAVSLQNGRAVVTMHIQPRYAHVYRDATILVRPRTALEDETIELSRGTPAAGALPGGSTLAVSQTLPEVHLDEVLATLDADTREYLAVLVGGGGQALGGNGPALAAGLGRLDPTAIALARVTRLLSRRHAELARAVHDFSLLASALGGTDQQLSGLVGSANAVFATFAAQDTAVRRTLGRLPKALRATDAALAPLSRTAAQLGPTLARLQPSAQSLGAGLAATRSLLRSSTPVLAGEVRPFARAALPVLRTLAPATASVANALPSLHTSVGVLDELANELASEPGGGRQGFLFYAAWAAHNVDSVLSTGDGVGPLRQGMLLFSCPSLTVLQAAANVNPTVQLLLGLLNPPNACGAS
jgi:phospholipid/cholesterol/gamma-HCH transport system substrate-binding protein